MSEDRYTTNSFRDESFEKNIIEFKNSAQSFMNSMMQINTSQKSQIEDLKHQLKDAQEELIDYKRELNNLKNQPSAVDIMQTILPILSEIVEETVNTCESKDDNDKKIEYIKSDIFRYYSKLVRELGKKGIIIKMHRPGDDYDRIALRDPVVKSTPNMELDGKIAISKKIGFNIPSIIGASDDEIVILYKYDGTGSDNASDVPEKVTVNEPVAKAIEEQINDDNQDKAFETITYEEIGFGASVDEHVRDELIIPVGKCDNEVFNLHFNGISQNQGYVVLGRPGSGKSSILDAVIINGSMKYSPKDLEFCVVDLKDGCLIGKYKKSNIPHIRSLHNNYDGFVIALNELKQTIKERKDLFSIEGKKVCGREFTSIDEYNEYLEKNSQSDNRLSRIIFIIDEAQHIFNNCLDYSEKSKMQELISDLFKEFASVGIYLLVLAQDFSGDSSYMLRDALASKLGGKICFSLSTHSLKESSFGSDFCDQILNIDYLECGEAYATSSNKETPKKIKVAFCPEDKLEHYCKIISEKAVSPINIEEPILEEPIAKKNRFVYFKTDIIIKQQGWSVRPITLAEKYEPHLISENPNPLKLSKSSGFSLDGAVSISYIDNNSNELLWCITDKGHQDSNDIYLQIALQSVDGYLVDKKIDESFIEKIVIEEK